MSNSKPLDWWVGLVASLLVVSASDAINAQTVGAVRTLSTPGRSAVNAQMLELSNGDIVAVWSETWLGPDLRASRRSGASRTWSPPVTVASYPTGNLFDDVGSISLAEDGAGNVMLGWIVRSNSGGAGWKAIQYSRYTVSTDSWSPAADLPDSRSAFSELAGLSLVMDRAGNATAAWTENPYNTLMSSRFTASTATWSAKHRFDWFAGQPHMTVGATGNVTIAWPSHVSQSQTTIQSARYSASDNTWGATVDVGSAPSVGYLRLRSDGSNAIAMWTAFADATPSSIHIARFDEGRNAWDPAFLVPGTANGRDARFMVDSSGNIGMMWYVYVASIKVVHATRYDAASGTWANPAALSSPDRNADPGEIAFDSAGNMIAVWNWFNGTEQVAQLASFTRVTGRWSRVVDLGLMGNGGQHVQIVVDPTNIPVAIWDYQHLVGTGRFAFWIRAIQSTEWTANAPIPALTSVTPGIEMLTVAFTTQQTDVEFRPLSYEYSLDNGATWIARSPTVTGSPITIDGLAGGATYQIRLRAITAAGPGAASAAGVGTPLGFPPPVNLRGSVVGHSVTLTWSMPSGNPPTEYLIEAGDLPGRVLLSLPTSKPETTVTLQAPSGAFYVRVRALTGVERSAPSNEIRIVVGVPGIPDPPESLTGTAVGQTLALQWRVNRDADLPDAIVLNVSGSLSTVVTLPGSASTFSFPAVPSGTYTFSVRAVTGAGFSASSNPLTLTFPGTCTVPSVPWALAANVADGMVTFDWRAPAGGAAPLYVIEAGSAPGRANLATINTGSTATVFSAVAPAGRYFVRVRAVNGCGTSGPSNDVMFVVP